MIHLDKLRQAYMLAALNTKEVHSKQSKEIYDAIPNYKIGDLVMIRNFEIQTKIINIKCILLQLYLVNQTTILEFLIT